MKILTLIILALPSILFSNQVTVCIDCEYKSLESVVNDVVPGDTILISGTLTNGDRVVNLKGTPSNWIYIKGKDNAKYSGGNTGIQFSDCEYLYISDLTIEGQLLNGMNIDDAGTFDTPTHHIRIENCTFRDIAATGNNDLLKLSGFDDFEITNCKFLNGSPGGSGVDMVGCHNGLIAGNHFENLGSNSVQAKGGTRDIRITRNIFVDGGNRAVNIGGSTGLAYFRPQDSKTESQDMYVYSNIFVGGECAVAYVGTVNSHVFNNTIIGSRKWVFRILQETVDAERFLSCGDNSFFNNAVLLDETLSMTVNIGPNTRPESFEFESNLWYHINNLTWNHNLPVKEKNGIMGQNPNLEIKYGYEVYPSQNSPAVNKGKHLNELTLDFESIPFATEPTIGAFEVNPISSISNADITENIILEGSKILINDKRYERVKIYNYSGKLLWESEINSDEICLNNIKENHYIAVLESEKTKKVLLIRR
ncbi:MAG: right-handed parallel beta-helix repeat-containing protein [Candidatus Kapaibacterium sp.]